MKYFLSALFFLLVLLLLAMMTSCAEPQKPGGSSTVETTRFSAEFQGTFSCGRGDRESNRSIYIITDTKTGVAYLAVQGCGTSQLVSESSGKTSRTVER